MVQVAAHGRCVLVQRTMHKNLHFKNSITRRWFRQLVMAPEVIFGSYIASPAGVYRTALDAPVLSAAGRGVWFAGRSAWTLRPGTQRIIHKNLHFKNSTYSLDSAAVAMGA